jgi:hypothetical protein
MAGEVDRSSRDDKTQNSDGAVDRVVADHHFLHGIQQANVR